MATKSAEKPVVWEGGQTLAFEVASVKVTSGRTYGSSRASQHFAIVVSSGYAPALARNHANLAFGGGFGDGFRA